MRNTCRTSLGFLALHGWPDWVLLTWVPLQTWEGYPDWVLYRLIIGASSEEHGSEDLLIDEVDFAPLSLAQFPRTGRGGKGSTNLQQPIQIIWFLDVSCKFFPSTSFNQPNASWDGLFPMFAPRGVPRSRVRTFRPTPVRAARVLVV